MVNKMGYRTFRYRRNGKEIESKIFDSDLIPEGDGWVGSPAKVEPAPEIKPDKPVQADISKAIDMAVRAAVKSTEERMRKEFAASSSKKKGKGGENA